MEFCNCKSKRFRWRDVALINGIYYKVDEEVFIENGLEKDHPKSVFDIDPIFFDLSQKHNVDKDDVILSTFANGDIPQSIISKFWPNKELGGYCAKCGGDI